MWEVNGPSLIELKEGRRIPAIRRLGELTAGDVESFCQEMSEQSLLDPRPLVIGGHLEVVDCGQVITGLRDGVYGTMWVVWDGSHFHWHWEGCLDSGIWRLSGDEWVEWVSGRVIPATRRDLILLPVDREGTLCGVDPRRQVIGGTTTRLPSGAVKVYGIRRGVYGRMVVSLGEKAYKYTWEVI